MNFRTELQFSIACIVFVVCGSLPERERYGCLYGQNTLDCTSRSLTNVPQFEKDDSLDILRLLNNQIAQLKVGIFDNVKNIRRLLLHRNKITKLPLGIFDALKKLEMMTLYSNPILSLDVSVFDELIMNSLNYLLLPIVCNCSENKMSILPFIKNNPLRYGIYIYNDNHKSWTTEWTELVNTCKSTWLDIPSVCDRFWTKQDTTDMNSSPAMALSSTTADAEVTVEDTTDMYSSSKAALASTTEEAEVTVEGVVYTAVSAILGFIASAVILYQGLSLVIKTGKTPNMTKKEIEKHTEDYMDTLTEEMFTDDMENTIEVRKCMNAPPICHRELVFFEH